jgi:hypothetical protein
LFYNSSRYDSIFDWLFSASGIICLLLFIGVIWLIVRFMNKTEKNENEVYLPPNNKRYGDEFGSDNSFWDDIRQEQQENPQREEEPIPPNAIQPTPNMAVVTTETYMTNQSDEMEKDCSMQLPKEENMYVDETALNEIQAQQSQNENKGE